MPRILGFVDSCGECPHHGHRSGTVSECKKLHQVVIDPTKVAGFCPLPIYPDQYIADLEQTLKMERDPHQYTLSYMLIVHVARKFDLLLHNRGMIFKIKDGSTVSLEFDHIKEIDFTGIEIHFMYGGRTYKVAPDIREPALYKHVDIPGRAEPAWEKLEIAR